MKSKKCLFNKTLFQSNLKRYWPFALLLGLAEFLIFPMSAFYELTALTYTERKHPAAMALDDILTQIVASDVIVFIAATVMALLVFSYLFTTNKTNALHAFPIGRKSLFVTNFVSGYLFLIVPQLIAFVLAIAAYAFTYSGGWDALLFQMVEILAYTFIVYAIAVFSMMLAGHFFSGLAICGILNFLQPVLLLIVYGAAGIIGYGLNENYLDDAQFYLSPVTHLLLTKMNASYAYADVVDKMVAGYYKDIICYVLAAAVLTVLSYFLYKKRKLECAGEMAAFKAIIPVLGVIVSVCGGAILSYIVGAIFGFSPVGYAIFYVPASFVFFFAAMMVLYKEFRVFKAKQLIAWAVTCAVSIAVVYGYATYQSNYVPAVSLVKEATVNVTYDITVTDKSSVETVEELHRALIDDQRSSNSGGRSVFSSESMPDYNQCISVEYTLKSGRKVDRTYYVGAVNKSAFKKPIEALESAKKPQSILQQIKDVPYEVKKITYTEYTAENEKTYLIFDEKDMQKVLQLYQQDYEAAIKDYSSVSSVSGFVDEYVEITCTVPAKTYQQYRDVLDNAGNSSTFDHSYISGGYDDIDETNVITKSGDYAITIYINSMPVGSKTLEFIKAKGLS